jgi:hypothetical protein
MWSSFYRLNADRSSTLALEPDVLAHHQYFKTAGQTGPAEPERALMFAVLAEAVETYQKFALSKSAQGQALFREAEAWFWGQESESLFSFLTICEVFGLDPASLRRGLTQWRANRRRDSSLRKRIQLRSGRTRRRKPLSDVAMRLALNHPRADRSIQR